MQFVYILMVGGISKIAHRRLGFAKRDAQLRAKVYMSWTQISPYEWIAVGQEGEGYRIERVPLED